MYEFSEHPVYIDNEEYESEWQYVDATLNNALEYGISAAEVAERIRGGALDLGNLCGWLDTVLSWPNVSLALLEGKLLRLSEALLLWYAICDAFD